MLSEVERARAALAEDFEIVSELGRGGMATVFLARDKALGREVAIKVLPAHVMSDTALVQRFEHESRTAGNLEHPNIIPIYRYGRAGAKRDVSYFVMKLLRGQSLSAVLKERGKLPPDELRVLLTETASALAYAAKHNVVHRDIKPDNILFDNEGRAVLTDFGIAKTPTGHHSAAGMLVGTPRYMSPEHALNQPLDGRSDLYSLGVVAYECLLGRPPFDAADPLDIIYKHIHEPLPSPPQLTEEERDLYRVIHRMLAKRPAERYQHANDVIVALGGRAPAPSMEMEAAMVTVPVRTLSAQSTDPEIAVIAPPAKSNLWLRVGVVVAAAVGVGALVLVPKMSTTVVEADSVRNDAAAVTKTTAPIQQPIRETKSVATPTAVAPPVAAPKPPPRPKPSARALAILAYNRLKSACPRRDTLVTSKPIEFAVLMDSVADRERAESMDVVYDVCGLESGIAFTTKFTLTKLRQRGFRQQKPYDEVSTLTAKSPRARQTRKLNTTEMSPGSYRLDVVVTDAASRVASASREFRIRE